MSAYAEFAPVAPRLNYCDSPQRGGIVEEEGEDSHSHGDTLDPAPQAKRTDEARPIHGVELRQVHGIRDAAGVKALRGEVGSRRTERLHNHVRRQSATSTVGRGVDEDISGLILDEEQFY